jgi:hypothetical protein
MESPFGQGNGKGNGTFVLYLEPILNTYYKTYQNIITVSDMPHGPLADMVTLINLPKLSPFQEAGVFSAPSLGRGMGSCVNVLLRYPKSGTGTGTGRTIGKNTDHFLGADDIPSVLGYLVSNGYKVDTSITKMLQNSRVLIGGSSERRFSGDRKMICIVSS